MIKQSPFFESLVVVFLLISLAVPAQAGDKSASGIVDTETYKKWIVCSTKVTGLMEQYKFSQALEESQPLIQYLNELGLTHGKEMFETCNNLGAIHLHLQNFQPAHNYFWTAMKIGNEIYGSESLEVGFVFKNLSRLYGERANQIFIKNKDKLGITDDPAQTK